MRILIAHNFYQQPGGEDVVFEAEARLLESHGHSVFRYTLHNDAIRDMNPLKLALATFWNPHSYAQIAALVERERIQVAHFHNTFPLLSPAGWMAARRSGAAIVQTLHNHRRICPNAVLFRDGRPCQDCLGRCFAWPAILHACYRGSRLSTAAVALQQTALRIPGAGQADLYIAPSRSMRNACVAGGLQIDRIVIKPHFVDPDPGPGPGDGNYLVFAGRLSPEKGVATLLKAWPLLRERRRLLIVGDGPLAPLLRTAAPGIQWLGRQRLDEVYRLIGDAAALIFPSECSETFGRTIVEAFAKGTPVIASGEGSAREMVCEGKTGLFFEPGNAGDLARTIDRLFADTQALRPMRAAARVEYETKYTAAGNYRQLISVYERAFAIRHCRQAIRLCHDELGRWEPA